MDIDVSHKTDSLRKISSAVIKNEVQNDYNSSTYKFILEIENEMNNKGTTIVAELNNLYKYYLNELSRVYGKDKENTLKKIDILNEAINAFNSELHSHLNKSNNTVLYNSSVLGQAPFYISPSCECDWFNILSNNACGHCQIYWNIQNSVLIIVAGFQVRGWTLAADLMLHNIANEELDSDYTPNQNLVDRVKLATQIKNEVATREDLTDGFTHTSPGRLNGLFEDTIEGDVFNALGSFFYSKSDAGNGNVEISILDRYDWMRGSSSPGGILIDTLVIAQEIGLVTPFYTKIDFTVPGQASLKWEYVNDTIVITGAAKNLSYINIPKEFYDLRARNTNLPKVYSSEIAANAFYYNSNLISINLSESVKKIGSNAFANCSNLKTIDIPQSVKEIGSNAFYKCTNLTIYTKEIFRLEGWSQDWNSSDVPVIWGGYNRNLFNDTLLLSNYNFPSDYNNFTQISQSFTAQSGQYIRTERLRCGVIDYLGESYLTLSAKNKDATQAYLAYYFSDYINKIDYQLALWSANESLVLNSSIRLEALYNNQWTLIEYFDARLMSQDKDILIDYSILLKEPSKAFRFIVETNQVLNDNNRGRVVIGNIVVEQINHDHRYLYCEKFSKDQHKAFCHCGESVLRPHAVDKTYTFNGHTYGNCIECKELVDFGTTIVIVPFSVKTIPSYTLLSNVNNEKTEYYFSDVSYIKNDGIIILAYKDIQHYLEGISLIDFKQSSEEILNIY